MQLNSWQCTHSDSLCYKMKGNKNLSNLTSPDSNAGREFRDRGMQLQKLSCKSIARHKFLHSLLRK